MKKELKELVAKYREDLTLRDMGAAAAATMRKIEKIATSAELVEIYKSIHGPKDPKAKKPKVKTVYR